MRLLLIRHAETAGNQRHFVGREDLDLTDEGRRQVVALTHAVASEAIHLVLASPLKRALDTARPLADTRGLSVGVRSGLLEIDYGELQGRDKSGPPLRLRRQYLETPMPGGESLRDVWTRLAPVAAELERALRAGRVPAVVSHYWSSRLLLAQLSGIPFDMALNDRTFKPRNASAYAIDFTLTNGRVRCHHARWICDGAAPPPR